MPISRLPLESPGKKCYLDVGLVERHKVHYKGEGGGFPQVRVILSLVSPNCLWLFLAPKVLQLCTNHFVLVLCKLVWVVEACQVFLVSSRSSSTPLYPFKVLRTRERAPTLCSFDVFYLGFTFESLKELGVHHMFLLGTFREHILNNKASLPPHPKKNSKGKKWALMIKALKLWA